MGDIIAFRPRPSSHQRPTSQDRPKLVPRRERRDTDIDFYAAAYDLHRQIAKDFRFFVMIDGCPKGGKALYDVSERLHSALQTLASEFGSRALRNLGSIQVCFSRTKNELSKREGFLTLFLNNSFSLRDVAALLTPSLRGPSKSAS